MPFYLPNSCHHQLERGTSVHFPPRLMPWLGDVAVNRGRKQHIPFSPHESMLLSLSLVKVERVKQRFPLTNEGPERVLFTINDKEMVFIE